MEKAQLSPEVRIAVLEHDTERIFKHQDEIRAGLNSILSKLSELPCEKHLGERKVLEERMRGFRIELNWMWSVVGAIVVVIVGAAIKALGHL